MKPTDALETINVDQIVTATDRLLLGGARKRRPPTPRSAFDVQYEEKTQFIRRPPTKRRTLWRATATMLAATATFALTVVLLA